METFVATDLLLTVSLCQFGFKVSDDSAVKVSNDLG